MDAHYQFLQLQYDIWANEQYNHCKGEGKFLLFIDTLFVNLKYPGE